MKNKGKLEVPWWAYAIVRLVTNPSKALLAVYWDGWLEQAGLASSGVFNGRTWSSERREA